MTFFLPGHIIKTYFITSCQRHLPRLFSQMQLPNQSSRSGIRIPDPGCVLQSPSLFPPNVLTRLLPNNTVRHKACLQGTLYPIQRKLVDGLRHHCQDAVSVLYLVICT